MTRRHVVSEKRNARAARSLGGVRIAERAEQLRALGVDAAKVAVLLGVDSDALARYYEVQDELAGAA
ncbi:MAG: hypothetical protein ACRDWT_11420 [Jatrophihabitantaceae bacterium]